MSFLFRHRPKTPSCVIKSLRDAILKRASDPNDSQAAHSMQKYLLRLKHLILRSVSVSNNSTMAVQLFPGSLNGPDGNNIQQMNFSTEEMAKLVQEVCHTGLLELLVLHLELFDFEARKDLVVVFNGFVRRQVGLRYPTVEYIAYHDTILTLLVSGYN